ncbi:MAG TPA: hypothetical protein VLG11_05565 [Candidatus Saccharimonadales bacterium]|nr:hypothetical protein [Candidatus Saccharimonadales bacterium]
MDKEKPTTESRRSSRKRLFLGAGLVAAGSIIGLGLTGKSSFDDSPRAQQAIERHESPGDIQALNVLTVGDFLGGVVVGGGLFIAGGNIIANRRRYEISPPVLPEPQPKPEPEPEQPPEPPAA